MTAKNIFLNSVKQYKLKLKPVLYYFFAGLLVSLLVWQQTSASSDSTSKNQPSGADFTSIVSHNSTHSELSQLHLPFESAPAPKNHEIPDENELEEEVDFDWHLLLEETFFTSSSRFASESNPFTLDRSCMHARAQVPLFILYHSWKSFVA